MDKNKIQLLGHECTKDNNKDHQIQREFTFKGNKYVTTAYLAYYPNKADPHKNKDNGKSDAEPSRIKKLEKEIWGDDEKMKTWENNFMALFANGGTKLLDSKTYRIDRQFANDTFSNIAWQDNTKGGEKSKVYAQCLIARKPESASDELKKDQNLDMTGAFGFDPEQKKFMEFVKTALDESAMTTAKMTWVTMTSIGFTLFTGLSPKFKMYCNVTAKSFY